MRRRTFPNFIGDFASLQERQNRTEMVMRVIGFTPDKPYTLNVNDGTRNRVMIGKINGDYGIKIVNNTGDTIVFADGHITADGITTGSLDAGVVNVINLSASIIVTGELTANLIIGGTLDCSGITVANLDAGSITVGTFLNPNDRFTPGSLSGVKISDGTITGVKLVAYTIQADNIDSNAISSDKIAAGAVEADKINVSSLSAISSNIGTIIAGSIKADVINVGTLNADRIPGLNTSKLISGNYNVGWAGQPSKIYIRRGDTFGNAKLSWEGGSSIWNDGNNYMAINSVGERLYFYTGVGNLYALFQRGSAATFYSGVAVHGGGVTLDGDLRFDDAEHHVQNIDGLVGANDIRYVLGSDSYYHSFCNSSWNEHAWITAGGNLELDGNFVAHGSKLFRIQHPEDEDKYVQYASIEAPEVALKIRGKAKLASGKATVALPHHWELVTEAEGITIQLTPIDDCYGLFAPRVGMRRDSFKVKELMAGDSNAEFMWEVTAVRKGYAGFDIEPTKKDIIEKNVLEVINMEKEPRQKKRSELERKVFRAEYKRLTGKTFEEKKK